MCEIDHSSKLTHKVLKPSVTATMNVLQRKTEVSDKHNFLPIWHDLQSWTFDYIRLLNKPYENEVNLRRQNISLKFYQPLKLMLYFGKGFRSFHISNIGSVGQGG